MKLLSDSLGAPFEQSPRSQINLRIQIDLFIFKLEKRMPNKMIANEIRNGNIIVLQAAVQIVKHFEAKLCFWTIYKYNWLDWIYNTTLKMDTSSYMSNVGILQYSCEKPNLPPHQIPFSNSTLKVSLKCL